MSNGTPDKGSLPTPRTDALMRFGNKNGPLVTPREYLERSIARRPDGCWLWQRAKQKRGYGVLEVNGKAMQAHRFSYRELVGAIPAGMFVLHRCDVALCVNPEHLYLGTDKENLDDQYTRARRPFKLSRDSLRKMILMRDKGASQGEVAAELGVSRQAIAYWEQRHDRV